MTVYRIYTEDINREDTIKLVSKWFDGFTVYQAMGYWQGKAESSLIFEVIACQENFTSPVYDYAIRVQTVCKLIAEQNKQADVMVSTSPCEVFHYAK